MSEWRNIDTDRYQLHMDNLCTISLHVTTKWLGSGFQAEANVRLKDINSRRNSRILTADNEPYVDAVKELQQKAIDYALSVCQNHKAYISRIESELKKQKKGKKMCQKKSSKS